MVHYAIYINYIVHNFMQAVMQQSVWHGLFQIDITQRDVATNIYRN